MRSGPEAFLRRVGRAILPRSLVQAVRRAQLRRAMNQFSPRIVEHRYANRTLKVYLSDRTGESWYDHDWSYPLEIELLRRHRLRPGARVFDIGAHQGVVAMILANEVGPTGQVVAVEPSPNNARAATINKELNNISQLDIVNAAAAAAGGELAISEHSNARVDDGSGEWGQIPVAGVSIDELTLTFGQPDVLFIDVEGFEVEVLRGANDTLARQPDCFVEVHVSCGLERFGASPADVLAFFPSDRFRRVAFSDERPVPLEIRDSDDLRQALFRERFFLVATGLEHDAPNH